MRVGQKFIALQSSPSNIKKGKAYFIKEVLRHSIVMDLDHLKNYKIDTDKLPYTNTFEYYFGEMRRDPILHKNIKIL